MTGLSNKAQKYLADLHVKAMLFDMDVDIEALTLVPKSTYQEPYWLTQWKEKQASGDRFPEDYEGGPDERN